LATSPETRVVGKTLFVLEASKQTKGKQMPIVQAILETIEADMTKAQIVGISQVLKCFKHPKDPKGKSFLNDRPSFQYKRNDQLLFN